MGMDNIAALEKMPEASATQINASNNNQVKKQMSMSMIDQQTIQ